MNAPPLPQQMLLNLHDDQQGVGFKEHPLFSLENIYRAYRQCRRQKRGTLNAMRFEWDLENHILALHEELTNGRYRPGRSVAFLVDKPKRREIFAADFRDRVVHHILVGYLEPAWERRFIHDSYACRQGKGTHKGVERLRAFTRKVTANGTRRAWYLQLDIRGFFISIDRHMLYERIAAHEHDPAVLWLARTLIFHEPTAHCLLRHARQADFERLPSHKTLFKAAPECGLPIGNLTSQFFANVYLDAVDQFIKQTLKVRYYLRYCDDMVLLSVHRQELERWERQIEGFLTTRLRLQVNDRRKLRPVSDGIDFLGYIVRPGYVLVRRRVVGAFYERLECAEKILQRLGMTTDDITGRQIFPWHWPLIEQVRQWLSSYLGHLRHASAYRLTMDIRRRFSWLEEYVVWQSGKMFLRCPIPRHALRVSQQRLWFKGHLPGHLGLMQYGSYWEIMATATDVKEWLAALPPFPRRVPSGDLQAVLPTFWASAFPVAWIGETGRRVSQIAERAVILRWEKPNFPQCKQ